jgi:putative ABC transport system substrate-binding protein
MPVLKRAVAAMRRRKFIKLFGGAALAWPVLARAEQLGAMRRLGILLASPEGEPQTLAALAAFKTAIRELGWIEDRNLRIDERWAAGDPGQMQLLAQELVGLKPDVILAHTTPSLAALQRLTKTIPIVFVFVSDPIGGGFISSIAHPGGNITGFAQLEASLAGKWIGMLKELVPRIARAMLMFNPDTAPYFSYYLQPFVASARSRGIEPLSAPVRNDAEIEHAITSFRGRTDAGLVLMPDVFNAMRHNADLVITSTARYRVPAIYPYRFMVTAGGLISYGVDNPDLFRRSSLYVDRLLKGANPADLPVQLPTKFEMAINLQTAKALGLTVPPTLLASADEVIE